MVATAPPARRFVLLEVPGPWAGDLFQAGHLRPDVMAAVRAGAARIGARLLLIRRSGRHPLDPGHPRAWAVGEIGTGFSWGQWQQEDDLLAVDVGAELAALSRPGEPGASRPPARPLALVCTHGRHDLCCALEGRAAAAVAAAHPRVDVWECSHLGGDRFAANLLWLPSGLLFGGLNAANTTAVLDRALTGQVLLEHFRGRCGDPVVAQAAQWHLLRALGQTRPDAVRVRSIEAGPETERRARVVLTHEEQAYRIELTWTLQPARALTCAAGAAGTSSRARVYRLSGEPERLSALPAARGRS